MSVAFRVTPAPGSFTRAVTGTYTSVYLTNHKYMSGSSLTIPVFGLYAGTTNTVTFNFSFADGTQQTGSVPITTAAYTDPCNTINQATFVQGRTSTSALSFDYFLLKNYCSSDSPIVLDTDGNVRWANTAGVGTPTSAFFQNNVYASDGKTGLTVTSLDGVTAKIADYATSYNVTSTSHHNLDFGRDGLLLAVNTKAQTESNILEVDARGYVLQSWDLSSIISAAMVAGGDDPSGFVYPAPNDWFHNNATTYDAVHNWLVVSSRENFVMAIDYDPPGDGSVRKIHWLFGDMTKHWAQYPSLAAFALKLGSTATLPPIGQHGIAFDDEGDLRLFDDGFQSIFQKPAGLNRNRSLGQSYAIDPVAMTATQVFFDSPQPKLYSYVCGSLYEDLTPKNNLIDFASLGFGKRATIEGLSANLAMQFSLTIPQSNTCGAGWNAIQVHWENLQFN